MYAPGRGVEKGTGRRRQFKQVKGEDLNNKRRTTKQQKKRQHTRQQIEGYGGEWKGKKKKLKEKAEEEDHEKERRGAHGPRFEVVGNGGIPERCKVGWHRKKKETR